MKAKSISTPRKQKRPSLKQSRKSEEPSAAQGRWNTAAPTSTTNLRDGIQKPPESAATGSFRQWCDLTPADKAALETYKRGRAKIGPRLKVAGNAVTVDHPDRALGHFAMLKAIGSSDSDFLNGLLKQVVNAGSHSPNADENGINFLLSVVKGVEPQDPIEAMLALQMGAVHNATMTFAGRLAHVETIQQQDSAQTALNKLARTFAAQVEALKRYRSSGEQKMTVQHVHVAEGGQAIVGNVSTTAPGGGAHKKSEEQPHALGHAPGIEMPRQIEEERATVPSAGGSGE